MAPNAKCQLVLVLALWLVLVADTGCAMLWLTGVGAVRWFLWRCWSACRRLSSRHRVTYRRRRSRSAANKHCSLGRSLIHWAYCRRRMLATYLWGDFVHLWTILDLVLPLGFLISRHYPACCLGVSQREGRSGLQREPLGLFVWKFSRVGCPFYCQTSNEGLHKSQKFILVFSQVPWCGVFACATFGSDSVFSAICLSVIGITKRISLIFMKFEE